jgi:hypothetical protein
MSGQEGKNIYAIDLVINRAQNSITCLISQSPFLQAKRGLVVMYMRLHGISSDYRWIVISQNQKIPFCGMKILPFVELHATLGAV